ncbi:MAG: hypothetical protein CL674_14385 [Bdellovibrionaceae bacterium]|jgi:hypothetical protein|nr:hypothetical protein [Pseudobdellovibrionaceae bacterium]MAF92455.1 hypothetical protein [Pseudobdellovibrionaceae bacterium]QDP47598.1 MAG: hypothetical protein GOVbin1174_46 [Prokaryotic dsDNA virus sp.]|tara:strand:- start:224 stop:652 length:429 start_codon:yes stop_codon:yes gene_type:complete
MNQKLLMHLFLLADEMEINLYRQSISSIIYRIQSLSYGKDENFSYKYVVSEFGPFDSRIFTNLNTLMENKLIERIFEGFRQIFKITHHGHTEAMDDSLFVLPSLNDVFISVLELYQNVKEENWQKYNYETLKLREYEFGDVI